MTLEQQLWIDTVSYYLAHDVHYLMVRENPQEILYILDGIGSITDWFRFGEPVDRDDEEHYDYSYDVENEYEVLTAKQDIYNNDCTMFKSKGYKHISRWYTPIYPYPFPRIDDWDANDYEFILDQINTKLNSFNLPFKIKFCDMESDHFSVFL